MKLAHLIENKEIPMFVLCGGLGTRLRDSLGELPKSLAPVEGKPFIEFILKHWVDNNVKHFVFLLGHRAELIREYLEEANIRIFKHCKFEYVTEEEILGTGGAVANALYKLSFHGDFFLVNSDTWLSTNLNSFSQLNPPSIGVVFQKDTRRYGRVELSQKKIVLSFHEKSNSNNSGFINCGLYLLNSNLFNNWDGRACSIEEEYLIKFVKEGVLSGVHLETSFIDIGVPQDYEYFKNNFMKLIDE